jgi:hypothetical protein
MKWKPVSVEWLYKERTQLIAEFQQKIGAITSQLTNILKVGRSG